MTSTLVALGYIQSKSDYLLFTKFNNDQFTVVLIYVDDLLLVGNNMNEIIKLKVLLNEKFSIEDLGNLKYFLGFEIAPSSRGILVCPREYNLDLLQETSLVGAKPATPPMDPTRTIQSISNNLISNLTNFCSLIGKLLY